MLLAAYVVWSGQGYAKGLWAQKAFEGAVRDVIRLNPLMKDDEFVMRLGDKAVEIGVTYDQASLFIDRRAMTSLASGGISVVRVEYTVPMRAGLFSWDSTVVREVMP